MSDRLYAEVLVVTWPFQTGVVVYEPIGAIEVAGWNLEELAGRPNVLYQYAHLLNPARDYQTRATGIVSLLNGDTETLQEVFGTADIDLVLSDDIIRATSTVLRPYGMSLADVALTNLSTTMELWDTWLLEEVERFYAEWVAKFRPLHGGIITDIETPHLSDWQESYKTRLHDWSFIDIVRSYYWHRRFFSEYPAPMHAAWEELQQLFYGS